MKVYLRKKKLNNDMSSYYIEYYKGYKRLSNGQVKHIRDYEFIDVKIYNFPKNSTERQYNKQNEKLAENIFTMRKSEMLEGKFRLYNDKKQKINFIDYYVKEMKLRKTSKGNYGNWESALKHLIKYTNPDTTTFKDIDEKFILGFKDYLDKVAETKSDTKLSQNSKAAYFSKLKAVINKAHHEKILIENPLIGIKGYKQADPKREYLTMEEVQALAKTDCRYDVLKRAFLFSCLTGLRWSDINKLVWSEIINHNGNYRIIFRQKKTGELEYLYITNQARELLGELGKATDRVFKGLKYSAYINVEIVRWCTKAGITKNVTFHVARHTFATLQMTLGTDIYTISKLLGHKYISTTQIYTKVIDEKKREAVNKIPEIILENG